jgi:hypothetical protein
MYFGLETFGKIVLVCSIFPPMTVVVIPLIFGYLQLQSEFRPAARDLKRLDGITRSPLYAHISAATSGLSSLRAFEAGPRFSRDTARKLDLNHKSLMDFWCANR